MCYYNDTIEKSLLILITSDASRGTCKHVVRDYADIPADSLIEGKSTTKHILPITNLANVPLADISVEFMSNIKHRMHGINFGNVPLADISVE